MEGCGIPFSGESCLTLHAVKGYRLIWVGKQHRRGPEALLSEKYLQRIGHFVKIDLRVVKPVRDPSDQLIQQRESQKILGLMEEKDYLIASDERGRQMSSPQLAQFLEERHQRGGGRLVWVVGGAMGLSEELRQRAAFMLSLSKMTLPHALSRVVLLEQIYRAHCIRTGHPYHHEG